MLFLFMAVFPIILISLYFYLLFIKKQKLEARFNYYIDKYKVNYVLEEKVLIEKKLIKWALNFVSLSRLDTLITPELKKQVLSAGWSSKNATAIFIAIMSLIGIVIIILVVVGAILSKTWFYLIAKSLTRLVLTTIIIIYLFIKIPNLLLKLAIKNYQQRLIRELPYFFELYMLNVASGFNSVQAWENVQYLMIDVFPRTSEQINLLIAELNSLPNHDMAWLNFIDRVDDEGIKEAIRIMRQCEVSGLPLEKDLSTQIDQIHKHYLANVENKIAKLPTLMLFPMMTFIFPSLFIILLGPGIIKAISSFKL